MQCSWIPWRITCIQLQKLHKKHETLWMTALYVKMSSHSFYRDYAAFNLPSILYFLPLPEDSQASQNMS